MKTKFIILTLIISTLHVSALRAEDEPQATGTVGSRYNRHEFSAYIAGGLSTLLYTLDGVGDKGAGFGTQAGVDYSLFLSKNWNIKVGAEIRQVSSTVDMNNLITSCKSYDYEGSEFEFRSVLRDYHEKQKITALQIPIIVNYTLSTSVPFYFGLGFKFGIPLTGTYTNSTGRIKTSGYYSLENQEYSAGYEYRGFGTFLDRKSSGNLEFNNAFFLFAEAGVKYTFRAINPLKGKQLHVSVFVDYGINNLATKDKKDFVVYDDGTPEFFTENSILLSKYTHEGVSSPFTEVIRPITVGVKFQVVFGW